jgi:hypothetical protein
VWYNTYPDAQSYRDYLIYTYDVFFGNWQAIDPQESDLRALVLIFVLFTVLFPIIIMNLLIALLNESYEDTPPNADFGIKLDMILEIIESRMLCRRLFKKKEIRKNTRGMKSYEFQWNIGNCYLYICMRPIGSGPKIIWVGIMTGRKRFTRWVKSRSLMQG